MIFHFPLPAKTKSQHFASFPKPKRQDWLSILECRRRSNLHRYRRVVKPCLPTWAIAATVFDEHCPISDFSPTYSQKLHRQEHTKPARQRISPLAVFCNTSKYHHPSSLPCSSFA